MQVPTTKDHFQKYARLTELCGLTATQSMFMGLTPEQMRAKLRLDPHLNNVKRLGSWDSSAYHLVGLSQPYANDGQLREPAGNWRISQSEAVCCMKHWATFHFAGCKPLFEDTGMNR